MTSADPGAAHVGADDDLLGLERRGSGRWAFTLTAPFARFDGRLYGGTALAVSLATAEAETGRRALWSTVQFVASAAVGDTLEVHTEVLAHGGRASQVRITATVDDAVVFCGLGANARLREHGLDGVFEAMPAVTGPDDSDGFRLPFADQVPRERRVAIERNLELRVARPLDSDRTAGRTTLWARVPGRVATPAVLGYLSDFVPMGIALAAGRAGGGTSLDNTVRIGPPSDTEWVLLDLDPQLAVGGYGHGTAHLFSPEGALLGTGSQTASMLLFD